jgi:hypothetical protein
MFYGVKYQIDTVSPANKPLPDILIVTQIHLSTDVPVF